MFSLVLFHILLPTHLHSHIHGFFPYFLHWEFFPLSTVLEMPPILFWQFLLNFNSQVWLQGLFFVLGLGLILFVCLDPVHIVFFIAFLCNSFPIFHILFTLLSVCLGSASSHTASHHCLAQLQGLGFPGSQHFSFCLGHSLIFALSSSMKRLLSSRSILKSFYLTLFSTPFSFPVILKFHLNGFWERKNKTCGLVDSRWSLIP